MSFDYSDWPAQEPSPDFAAKTVSAILGAEQGTRSKGRRWLIPCALAAIFVGSGAWAMIARHQAPEPEPTPSATAPAREVLPPTAQPTLDTMVAPRVPAKPAEVESPPSRPAIRPRPTAAASTAAPESKPDAGNFVVFPRCICEHGTVICSCVE
jgi:hypothetical protein